MSAAVISPLVRSFLSEVQDEEPDLISAGTILAATRRSSIGEGYPSPDIPWATVDDVVARQGPKRVILPYIPCE